MYNEVAQFPNANLSLNNDYNIQFNSIIYNNSVYNELPIKTILKL